jgi:DNA-binding CsgD family transcriptional regulator
LREAGKRAPAVAKQRRRIGRAEAIQGLVRDSSRETGRALATTDPVYTVINDTLNLVPTSAWAFARIEHNGAFASPVGSKMGRDELVALGAEYDLQRAVVPVGPRIASMLGSFPGSVAGVCLIFADGRAEYGIMMLLRDESMLAFSSVEIRLLTFSLSAGCDRLATLRLQPAVKLPSMLPRRVVPTPPLPHEEGFYVLNRDMEIVLAWSAEGERRMLSPDGSELEERLPTVLEQSVRELTAPWPASAVKEPGIALPVSFLVVRTHPLTGLVGDFVGVRIERFRPPNSLAVPAARFQISPREVQVLALLLDGDHLDQISLKLNITSSTVQGHIKSMLDKTESRNRSELIARILGWESPANPDARARAR